MQGCDDMEYLIGSLATLVFFALIGGAYYLGTKSQKKPKPQVDELEKRRQEQLKKDFEEMMNYNVDKALGGGKR